jgi:hypothetical protein
MRDQQRTVKLVRLSDYPGAKRWRLVGPHERAAIDEIAKLPPAVTDARPASVILGKRFGRFADDEQQPERVRVHLDAMHQTLASQHDDDSEPLAVVRS